MGNSLGGFSLLNAGDGSYHFQLGKSVYINMKDGEYKQEVDGKVTKTWEASYDVEGLTCTLSMIQNWENGELEINIKDSTDREKISHEVIKEYSEGFSELVQRSETNGLLDVSYVCSGGYSRKARGRIIEAASSRYVLSPRDTTNSRGVTTSTTIWRYGSGTRQGLLVREWKKKKGDEKPYMGTIAHYYANSNNSPRFYQSRKDIGLSIVVKIRVSDDGYLRFTIDGPVQHPSSALFYMFEEVERTGVWKAMACPHCANIQSWQRHEWMPWWQSESEDSDSLPPARAGSYGRRRQQNARNKGVFVGDANGSIFENNNNIVFFSGRS